MTADAAYAGWQRMIYAGAAGGAASTLLEHAVDVNVNKPTETTETTDRGDGTEIPINTQQVVARGCEVSFTTRYYDSDAAVADLIAAAEEGEPRALKVLRANGGTQEVDADFNLSYDTPGALKDGMLISFTATLNRDYGRMPDIVSA